MTKARIRYQKKTGNAIHHGQCQAYIAAIIPATEPIKGKNANNAKTRPDAKIPHPKTSVAKQMTAYHWNKPIPKKTSCMKHPNTSFDLLIMIMGRDKVTLAAFFVLTTGDGNRLPG